jgi:sialate O-acetylesterase
MNTSFARVRDFQRQALSIPHTAMISAIDVGDASTVHPRNKQEIGRRLALAARATVYGESIEFTGPLFKSAKFVGNTARIEFSHAESGLVCHGEKLTGFAIAGADRKFVWADARIEGGSVVVSSPSVPNPASVRYGWADNPPVNLINQDGFPASPFRTDDW